MQGKPQFSFSFDYPNFLIPNYLHFRAWHLSYLNSKENNTISLGSQISCVSKIMDQESSSETLPREFQSHSEPCIILTSKKVFSQKKVKQFKFEEVKPEGKNPKKLPQKETRNVGSNLLRIFLKNLLELKIFNSAIQSVLIRNGGHYTSDQFYLWLHSFNINFKNYIKSGEIKKVVGREQPEIFKKLFIFLLKDYSDKSGLAHVLTSRRIEKNSIKMHIKGLRTLFREV